MKGFISLLKSIRDITRLQFTTDIDYLSFLMGYYTAYGKVSHLLNILRAHSITEEQLKDVTKIEETVYQHEIEALIREIMRVATEKGCSIPLWLTEKIKEYEGGDSK